MNRLVLGSLRSLSKSNLVKQVVSGSKFNAVSVTRSFSCSMQLFKPAASSSNVFKELTSFLNQEIQLEKEARKHKDLPKVAGFETKTDGPNVTLTKQHNGEEISVTFNVNGALNNTYDQALDAEKPEGQTEPEMKARPMFTIDIKKSGQVLSFSCEFLPEEEPAAEGATPAAEDFQINEFAIHSGDWNENVYTADCTVLDGQLYDILLNLLDERGIGEKFANELAEFTTAYEHSQYIGLLEKLKNFSA